MVILPKKKPFKRYFLSSVKLFVSLFLCIFYFAAKIRKTCHRNKQMTEPLKPIYWLRKPVLDSRWLQLWNNLCQILCILLEFLSSWEGLDCFLWHALTKLTKITMTCPKAVEGNKESVLTWPKLVKWISTLNCSKSAKWPIRKFIYLQSQGS